MDKRVAFHKILVEILGSNKVYFQSPDNINMDYPCIRYERSKVEGQRADNILYRHAVKYEVMVIDPKPENPAIKELLSLPMSTYDKQYRTNGLNHDVFIIYY